MDFARFEVALLMRSFCNVGVVNMQQGFNLVQRVRHAVRIIIETFAKLYSYLPFGLRKSFLYYYKKDLFPQKEQCVFYSFDSHWNSIESFLPILYWLKEQMGYRIISFWGVEEQHRFNPENDVYFKMLINVSDVVVLNGFSAIYDAEEPNRLKRVFNLAKHIFYFTLMQYGYSRECISIFKKYNLVSILRVADGDVQIWGWLYECFPSVKHITHPHAGFMGMLRLPDETWRQIYKRKFDIFTWTDTSCLDGPEDESCETFRERCVIVGTPRYDKWWRERIISIDYRINLFKQTILKIRWRKKIVVCFGSFTVFTPFNNDPEVTLNELNELKKFFFEYNEMDVLYIFKFHPMTAIIFPDIHVFFQKVVPQFQFEFQVTSLPLSFIANYVDLVISVGESSVAMDSVIIGTPTIEFHAKRAHEGWYRCPDGTYGSFLKLHQLALYASDAQELSSWVTLVLEKKVLWDEYYQRLQKYVMLDGCSSKRVGDIIQQCAESLIRRVDYV